VLFLIAEYISAVCVIIVPATFVNQSLSIIMGIRWPNIISNTAELQEATRDKLIML
jgi:nitrogen fixation/metabolism regulation signal transduction histidine kinase